MLGNIKSPARKARLQKDSPLALFHRYVRNFRRPIHIKLRFPMSKRDVNRVVLQIIDEVAGADISFHPKTLLVEIRIARQRRRLSLAKIDKDESQIFFCRTTPDAYLFGKGFVLRWLLDALPRTVKLPAMETAS